MSTKDKTQRLTLPAELEQRVRALAAATDNAPGDVLEQLVEGALADGESLGEAVGLPREICLARLHDMAHAGGELAGAAAATLDELDASEFGEQPALVDELADLLEDAGVDRKRLVEWLRAQLVRDFGGDASA